MIRRILTCEMEGVAPLAKSVLVLLVRWRVASGDPGAKTLEGWAKCLGVPSRVLGPQLRQLASGGFLRADVVSSNKPGRRGYAYGLVDTRIVRLSCLDGLPQGAPEHDGLLVRVWGGDATEVGNVPPRIGPDGKMIPPSRSGAAAALSLVNRLVLAILLSVADRGGRVQGVGLAQLSALAGMSLARCENSISKLMALGFIRAYVPGVSGSPVLGVVAGIYYMNLSHPDFGGLAAVTIAYACPIGRGLIDYRSRQLGDVRDLIFTAEKVAKVAKPGNHEAYRELAQQFKGFDIGSVVVVSGLAEILVRAGRQRLAGYLQHIIEIFAAKILTEGGGSADKDSLSESIGAVLYPSSRRKKAGIDPFKQPIDVLSTYFAHRAADIAKDLKSYMDAVQAATDCTPLIHQRPTCVVILPGLPAANPERMTVIALHDSILDRSARSFLLVPNEIRSLTYPDPREPDAILTKLSCKVQEHAITNFPDGGIQYRFGLFSDSGSGGRNVTH